MNESNIRSYFFYIKKRNINKSKKFNKIKIKTNFVNDSMTPYQMILAYARQIKKEKEHLIEIISQRKDLLESIAYEGNSNKIIQELKGERKFIDSATYQSVIKVVIETYKQMFSSIKYYKRKRETYESANMRQHLLSLWKATKEDYVSAITSEMLYYKEDSYNYKKLEQYVRILNNDITLFPMIKKIQNAWICKHSTYTPKSLTFRVTNKLAGSEDFIKFLDDKRIIITIQLPNIGKIKLISKYNRKYHGNFSDYKDTKSGKILKNGFREKSYHTYTLKFLENGDLKLIVTKELNDMVVPNYSKIPEESQIIGIDVNLRDNRMITSNNFIIPVPEDLIKHEDRLSKKIALHDKNCDRYRISKDRGKQLRLDEDKQKRRRKAKLDKDVSDTLKYERLSRIKMIVLEDINANSIKGYKSESLVYENIKNKVIQRALLIDDTKNVFIRMAYKYGLSVALVNPKYTSQECSHCHTILKENRSAGFYSCSCGYSGNADLNAAINIKDRMSNNLKREKLQYRGKRNGILLWLGKDFKNKKSFEIN